MMNMCAVAGLASIGIWRAPASILRSALTSPVGEPDNLRAAPVGRVLALP